MYVETSDVFSAGDDGQTDGPCWWPFLAQLYACPGQQHRKQTARDQPACIPAPPADAFCGCLLTLLGNPFQLVPEVGRCLPAFIRILRKAFLQNAVEHWCGCA